MDFAPELFASDLPIKKTLKLVLDDGTTKEHDFFIKELPAIEMRRQVLAESSGNEKIVQEALSALIARAVVDIDGKPAMTIAQANKLKPVVAGGLRDLIMEVNGFDAKKPKTP